MESSQDKSLPATARKLQKTRSEGQTSRSRDLSHLAVLGIGCAVVLAGGPTLLQHLRIEMGRQFTFDGATVLVPHVMLERLVSMMGLGILGVLVFALCINVATILLSLMSGGWVFSWTPIMPKFSKINPLAGLGNVFSKQQLVTAIKNVFLTLILGFIAWLHIRDGVAHVAKLPAQGSPMALAMAGDWILSGLMLLMLVVFIVALIDVPLQKFLFLQRLKMSHQEVKQEHKESEGSPEVKGKIRQKQREMAHRASVSRVPAADFVVTNPTHYAVALRYDSKEAPAPVVVAKGVDFLAQKIKDIARENRVPIRENKPLAQALYKNVEVGHPISEDLYKAVASILAEIFRIKGRRS